MHGRVRHSGGVPSASATDRRFVEASERNGLFSTPQPASSLGVERFSPCRLCTVLTFRPSLSSCTGLLTNVGTVPRNYETTVVFLLGYPGMGKRTVGGALAALIDAVLLDNARIHGVLLEPFRWDGVAPLPPEIWDRVTPIREALLGVIEDLAPAANSYGFTSALEDEESSKEHYDSIKALAARRGSLFLAVQLDCDIDVQVARIANPDRIALRKGADPPGYRWHRQNVKMFEPPAEDRFDIDTTSMSPDENAELICAELVRRGFTGCH